MVAAFSDQNVKKYDIKIVPYLKNSVWQINSILHRNYLTIHLNISYSAFQ